MRRSRLGLSARSLPTDVTPSSYDDLKVFRHLGAEKSRLYRAILDCFVLAKERFALHLRPWDLRREVNFTTA